MGILDLSISAPCLAGRLAHYVRNWEVITQDRWVLQAIMGYKLDLLQTPHQGRRSAVLHHSLTDQALITEEVQELLAKQAIKKTQISPNSFISQLFLVEKKGGGPETSCQPESSEQFRAIRTLQNGRPPHSPGSDSDRGSHDQTRSERCISSDPNTSGSPTSPPISVDGKDVPVQVPSLRTDISSKGIYRGAQATNCKTSTDGDLVSGLPGQHPYPPSQQGGVRVLSSADLQPVQSTGLGNQHQKIYTDTPTGHRILGISDKFSDSTDSDATGEAEENSARRDGCCSSSQSLCRI